jgi:glutamate dehydrogenase (NAD(P)+)
MVNPDSSLSHSNLGSNIEQYQVEGEFRMVRNRRGGPKKVLQVYDPDTGMKGVLVIDNISTGPWQRRNKVCGKCYPYGNPDN